MLFFFLRPYIFKADIQRGVKGRLSVAEANRLVGVLQQWRYYLSCHGINKHTKTSRKRSEQIGRTQQLSHTLFVAAVIKCDTPALKEPRLSSFLCQTSKADFLVLKATNSYYRSVSVRPIVLIHSFIYRCKCKKDFFPHVAFEKEHLQADALRVTQGQQLKENCPISSRGVWYVPKVNTKWTLKAVHSQRNCLLLIRGAIKQFVGEMQHCSAVCFAPDVLWH